MTIIMNPYLNFNGQAEQAFQFYQSIFGGEFSYFSRMGDVPDLPFPLCDTDKQRVMHVSLPIDQGITLMGSDIIESAGQTLTVGNHVHVSLNVDSADEAKRLFNALSANGTINMPLDNTFWGALFGSLTDQFGIQWMVNYQHTDI